MLRFSSRTRRIGGHGAEAWGTHRAALRARARGEDAIVMSVGDPEFDTPEAIVDAAVRALRAGDTHYTEILGRDALRGAIAGHFANRSGVPVSAANVVVAAGAQSALFSTALCLLDAGDEAIVLDPVYVTYEATLGAAGASVVRVAQPASGGFRPDPQAIEAAVTERTRAIFVINPSNPTGVNLTRTELGAIAEIAQCHDLWVVSDEVYAELVFDGGHVPMASLPGMAERTVTVASLSKSHAMTGWRLGWTIGPQALVSHLGNLNLCMLYGLPGFVQQAAVAALAGGDAEPARMRDIYRRRRDLVVDRLAGQPGLACTVPEAGMFLMLDVRALGMAGAEFASALYAEQRVSVLDGGAFGSEASGFVRVSFTLDDASLAAGCERIARFAATRTGG